MSIVLHSLNQSVVLNENHKPHMNVLLIYSQLTIFNTETNYFAGVLLPNLWSTQKLSNKTLESHRTIYFWNFQGFLHLSILLEPHYLLYYHLTPKTSVNVCHARSHHCTLSTMEHFVVPNKRKASICSILTVDGTDISDALLKRIYSCMIFYFLPIFLKSLQQTTSWFPLAPSWPFSDSSSG